MEMMRMPRMGPRSSSPTSMPGNGTRLRIPGMGGLSRMRLASGGSPMTVSSLKSSLMSPRRTMAESGLARFASGGPASMTSIAIEDALHSQPHQILPDYMMARLAKGGDVPYRPEPARNVFRGLRAEPEMWDDDFDFRNRVMQPDRYKAGKMLMQADRSSERVPDIKRRMLDDNWGTPDYMDTSEPGDPGLVDMLFDPSNVATSMRPMSMGAGAMLYAGDAGAPEAGGPRKWNWSASRARSDALLREIRSRLQPMPDPYRIRSRMSP